MIARLLWRDASARDLAIVAPVAILAAAVVRLAAGDVAAEFDAGSIAARGAAFGASWGAFFGIGVFLLFATGVWRRSGAFDVGLPVTGRALSGSRFLAVGLTAAIPVAAATVAFALTGGPRVDATVLAEGVRLVGELLALAAFLRLLGPGLRVVPVTRGRVLAAAAATGAVFAYGILTPLTAGTVVVPFLFALGAVAVDLARTPEGLLLDDATVEELDDRSRAGDRAQTRTDIGRSSRWIVQRLIVRELYYFWGPYVLLGALFVYGMGLGDLYGRGEDLTMVGAGGLLVAWVLVVQLVQRTYRVDRFPIPRRTILAWVLLPSAVVVACGVLFGTQIRGADAALVTRSESGISIPPEYYRVAGAQDVPSIDGPGGVSWRPVTQEPWSGSPWVVYSPYSCGTSCTDERLAWQEARALADIDEDHHSRTVAVGAAVAILGFVLASAVAFRATRASDTTRGYRIGLFAGLGLYIGVALTAFLGQSLGFASGSALGAAVWIAFGGVAEGLAIEPVTAWLAVGMLASGGYLILQREFSRVEVVGRHASDES
jgi:hypothetical protein